MAARRLGRVQLEPRDLVEIATKAFARRLTADEARGLNSGKAHWDLRRLPASVLIPAAAVLAASSKSISADKWLDIALALPEEKVDREAAWRRRVRLTAAEADLAVGRSRTTPIRASTPNSPQHAICTACGMVLNAGSICGCPAVENTGRPGS